MKRIVSFVMAAGMALSLAACGGAVSGASSTSTVAPVASSAAAADDGEILIGCLQDITGNTSGLGLSVQKGAQAAVDEINANGGINGKKIVMNTYDTKGDVTEAVNSYITAVTVDQVSLIVGPPVANIANAIKGKLLQEEAKKVLVDNITACDEVWTVSHGAGENLKSLGYQGDYLVMPNGVDFPKGRVDESLVREVTKDFDLPENIPMFLFVGRMMWYKGLKIILDALAMLKTQGRPFRMVFVGNGGDRDEVIAYSEKLGLSDCVFFTAPAYDRNVIRAWYCRADLFLFPSTFDTNGLVVREAAACGLGSVLVRGSCAAEDIRDGESGFLIEENAESMARMLTALSRNPEAMQRVGKTAQDEIYISWKDAVTHAQARYEVVLENFKAGKYPAHNRQSDEAFHAISSYLAAVGRGQEKIKLRMEELSERFL